MADDIELRRPSLEQAITSGVRSLATILPPTAWIATAWSEWENHQQFGRIEELFKSLRDHLVKCEHRLEDTAGALNIADEVAPLLERVARTVRLEPSKDKRGMFAAVLAEMLIGTLPLSFENKLNVLENLDSLTEQDIQVFLLMEGNGVWFNKLFKAVSTPEDQKMAVLTLSLSKLESRGLICDVPQKDAHGFDVCFDPVTATFSLKYFAVLPAGQLFRDVLRKSRY